jgi:hypothetical protein
VDVNVAVGGQWRFMRWICDTWRAGDEVDYAVGRACAGGGGVWTRGRARLRMSRSWAKLPAVSVERRRNLSYRLTDVEMLHKSEAT